MNKHPKHYDSIYIEFEYDPVSNMTKHSVFKCWADSHNEPLLKFWIPGNTCNVRTPKVSEMIKARLKQMNVTFNHYGAMYSVKRKQA